MLCLDGCPVLRWLPDPENSVRTEYIPTVDSETDLEPALPGTPKEHVSEESQQHRLKDEGGTEWLPSCFD